MIRADQYFNARLITSQFLMYMMDNAWIKM
jgi:hypothetical protein